MIADVNCSGDHSSLDAALILRYVADLDPYFPCAYENISTKALPPVAERYPGSEPGDFAVSLSSERVGPGETVFLPIMLSGSGELLGQEYHLRFDPERFHLAGVDPLAAAAGASLYWRESQPGELRIALASPEFMPVDAAVAVRLTGAETLLQPTTTDLRLEYARINEQVVGETENAVPAPFRLASNYPNPFNPKTTIEYIVPGIESTVAVSLRIYDLSGRLVRVLVDDAQSPGAHEAEWDGRDAVGHHAGSGVYFYRLEAGTYSATQKMVLVK